MKIESFVRRKRQGRKEAASRKACAPFSFVAAPAALGQRPLRRHRLGVRDDFFAHGRAGFPHDLTIHAIAQRLPPARHSARTRSRRNTTGWPPLRRSVGYRENAKVDISPTTADPCGNRSIAFSSSACSLTAWSPCIGPHSGRIASPVYRSCATSMRNRGQCDSHAEVRSRRISLTQFRGVRARASTSRPAGSARAWRRGRRPTRPSIARENVIAAVLHNRKRESLPCSDYRLPVLLDGGLPPSRHCRIRLQGNGQKLAGRSRSNSMTAVSRGAAPCSRCATSSHNTTRGE